MVQVRDTVTAWNTGNKPPAFVIEKNGVVIKNLANLLPHPRRMAMLRPERLPAPLPLHQLGIREALHAVLVLAKDTARGWKFRTKHK